MQIVHRFPLNEIEMVSRCIVLGVVHLNFTWNFFTTRYKVLYSFDDG